MQKRTFTLAELAELTHSKLVGDPNTIIHAVADLETATPKEISFLGNPRYRQAMLSSQAGAVFVDPSCTLPEGRNFLVTPTPLLAFQLVAETFFDALHHETTGFTGIHPTAVIHPSAKLGANVTIGPHVIIDKDVRIGDRTVLTAAVYVGAGVIIGSDCVIYPHVVIREFCQLGDRVTLQPGAVIGSCGFGYTQDKRGRHLKLRQIGNVVLEDDVEIGANTTIDRAHFATTRIKRGSKIDNLVQIAHNVTVGEDNIIVAQTGIAGSTETGQHVMMGGQVAVDGHLKIASGVMIAARSGVSKSFTTAGKYGGVPAFPLHEYNRNSVYLRNIETYINQIKALEERLDALENNE